MSRRKSEESDLPCELSIDSVTHKTKKLLSNSSRGLVGVDSAASCPCRPNSYFTV